MGVMFVDIMKNETLLDINQKFPQLMEVLDEKSKALFWHIWRNRHAQIRELSDLIRAPTDIYTLSRLKEVINPQAEKILGKKILTFEESRIDPLTGNKVLFSWWLNEECFDSGEENKGLVDIFDEKERLRIVMKLPVSGDRLKVALKPDRLIVFNKDYQKEIPLFYPVKKEIKKTCKNGILEICLEKNKK